MAARKRALVVDDNPDIRTSLQAALDVMGYDTEEAEDAAQAWEVASRIRPAVMVMDGNALEVIARVKAEEKPPFVVVFSGWAHLEATARAAGADAFVLKPDFGGLERVLSGMK